jgi:hypothetical protein
MIPEAITIDHHATEAARNKGFLGKEVGGDPSCSLVIGSRLAVDFQQWAIFAEGTKLLIWRAG